MIEAGVGFKTTVFGDQVMTCTHGCGKHTPHARLEVRADREGQPSRAIHVHICGACGFMSTLDWLLTTSHPWEDRTRGT